LQHRGLDRFLTGVTVARPSSRIKIWNDKTGEVIFDNQMGDDDDADPTTPVGDGNSMTFLR